jgi:malate dehydrogenase
MRDVAILGAGELGGALAHILARRNLADVIRLIDESGRVAEGKALDIEQAAPIDGFAGRIAGSTDLSTAAGSAVIVIADRVGGMEWQGEDGVLLIKRLAMLAPRAIVIAGGASHRDLVDRGVRELHRDRSRLFGSAPEALAAAARALLALAVDGSPRDVALTVLGVPPSHIVIPWDDATLAGLALTKQLDEPVRRRLAARISPLWPPGPYVLASAAAKIIESIFGGSRAIVSCFVAPDDTAGRRARTAAQPVRIGMSGVEGVVVPSLSVVDRVRFENAILL